ncbi:unnamed protein product, partial [Ectocarpus sp. 12 AP-2014]
MGLLVHEQDEQQHQRIRSATSSVIQALEVVDASATAGSQREGEKRWIRERLAKKRSLAECERQGQDTQHQQQH